MCFHSCSDKTYLKPDNPLPMTNQMKSCYESTLKEDGSMSSCRHCKVEQEHLARHLSLYGTGSLIISICDIILQGPTENNVNGSSKYTFDVQVAWTLRI